MHLCVPEVLEQHREFPTHACARDASINPNKPIETRELPTHACARNASLTQPCERSCVSSQLTPVHGMYRHGGSLRQRHGAPNSRLCTECIISHGTKYITGEAPNSRLCTECININVDALYAAAMLPTHACARNASPLELHYPWEQNSQLTPVHGMHRDPGQRGDVRQAPNSRLCTECISKAFQEMSRMYGLHIHNLYLIECLGYANAS